MKSKRTENYVLIKNYIMRNPGCTINKISRETCINWETIKYALETLIGLEVITDINKKYYCNIVKPIHNLSDERLKKYHIEKYLGSGLKCPNCKEEGSYGRITQVTEEDGSDWIVCSYCDTISEYKNENNKKIAAHPILLRNNEQGVLK